LTPTAVSDENPCGITLKRALKVNLSSDKENGYFSDDLIDAPAKVRGLRVVARGSAFQFKGKNPDIRGVAANHVWPETYGRRAKPTPQAN
jgi:TolB-like protein